MNPGRRGANPARAWTRALALVLLAGCQFIWPQRYKLREGQALEAKGQYASAVAAYEVVLTKWPHEPEAEQALSRAAALYEERLGNWQKAAAYLQELRSRTEGKPEYPAVLLRLARIQEHGGSPFHDSLETYGTLCKNCASAPEAVAGLLSQGRLFEALQNWPAAKSVYEDAVAKLGPSPEAATVRVRLQQVWLLEATSLYFSGRVEDGALLAEEALKKPITSDEVRNGLEVLAKRHRVAQAFWHGNAAAAMLVDQVVVDETDQAFFPHRFAEDALDPVAPAGWSVTFDAKRKRVTVTEVLAAPAPPSATVAAGSKGRTKPKPAPAPRKAGRPWTFTTPADRKVEGIWISPDGSFIAWIGKAASGKSRSLNGISLVQRKAWTVVPDPSGALLGRVVGILPYADKLVFPYEDYFVVSDLKGGNRQNLSVARDKVRGARFKGREVAWIACSPDAFEVAVGVRQPPAKPVKPKTKKEEPDAPRVAVFKLGLGVSE